VLQTFAQNKQAVQHRGMIVFPFKCLFVSDSFTVCYSLVLKLIWQLLLMC